MPQQLSDDDVANIRNAILAGRKIEAIKLYRAATGEGLKEGKDFIEALEAALARGESGEIAMPAANADLDPVKTAIFAGRKIEAIKQYRAATRKGLKDAKDFVEALEDELRRTQPGQFTTPPRGKGCASAIAFLIVVATLIATNL